MSDELTKDEKDKVREKLEFEMVIQKATQEINNHWEERVAKLKDMQAHEMQNIMTAQRTFSKPKWIDRIRGRYRDLYILFNNKIPIFCDQAECKSRRKGVDYGVQAICLSREQALDAAEEYWNNLKAFTGYSFNSLSILHFQVDRYGSREGMVVRDITLDQKEWNEETKEATKNELNKVTADKLVLDSLMSARPRKKK